MIKLERFLLEFVFNWKLNYSTPYDFIQVIVNHLYEASIREQLIEKAEQIAELLLLCNDILKS